MPDHFQLEYSILRLLGHGRYSGDAYLSGHNVAANLKANNLLDYEPGRYEVQQAIWALIARGLIYVDATQPSGSNWVVRLSSSGQAMLRDEEFNPNDPTGFMDRLKKALPTMSDTVSRYVREAVVAHYQQLYLASTVMLGVASEAAFIELATAFAATLKGEERVRFETALNKNNYVQKFSEFRKRIESKKNDLPKEFADGMPLMLDSVLDLLRLNRNEAGHPTGREFDRDDCFTALQMTPRYLKRLYGLKAHFEQGAAAAP